MKVKRTAFVQAKSFCIISVLKKSDIERIILSFPSILALFENQAKQRLENIVQVEE
jgi:hypothetical protein